MSLQATFTFQQYPTSSLPVIAIIDMPIDSVSDILRKDKLEETMRKVFVQKVAKIPRSSIWEDLQQLYQEFGVCIETAFFNGYFMHDKVSEFEYILQFTTIGRILLTVQVATEVYTEACLCSLEGVWLN